MPKINLLKIRILNLTTLIKLIVNKKKILYI